MSCPDNRVLFALVVVLALFTFSALIVFSAWSYASMQLAIARSQGIYFSAEDGMRDLTERAYVGITRLDILYAGPNSRNGRQSHVWYVIAEVRAARRAEGPQLGDHVCDAPGLFFIQTRGGWVQMPEAAFPELVGLWMNVFGLAGPGRSTPSTNWPDLQPIRLCQAA